jgi:dihydroorotate dehydrogenase electron transfer subunit
MKQFRAQILSNRPVCDDFFEMEFLWEKSALSPDPGQFLTVRISPATVPLLRRPFALSAYSPEKGTAGILYLKRGRGTEILAAKKKGDALDVLGPLGKAFRPPPKGKRALLVAGGVGVGPIAFLAAELQKKHSETTVVVGCRTASLVPDVSVIQRQDTSICTDDGTRGFRGTAGDYLKSIAGSVTGDTVIYACGPQGLLKTCHEFAAGRGCTCMVSVEQIMACGVGACMGCAVKAVSGKFVRACTEGPVFDSKELNWG